MPFPIIMNTLGFLALIVWSLAVLCLVALKVRREGFAAPSRRDWTESGLSVLISLLPKHGRTVFIPLLILTPIIGLVAIFWR
jgi:hypothetical protein